MKQLYQRGIAGALALLLDMVLERLPERWSAAAVSVAGLALARAPRRMPTHIGIWAEAALLRTTLGMNRLRSQATALDRRLEQGDLEGARREATLLLQRDRAAASAAALATDGICAVADGAADQVVAPLCYYLLLGLPGAMLYRLCVSMQSSLGPQGAQLVRGLRLMPARVTGALLVAAAHLRRENGVRAWRLWRRDGCDPTTAPELAPRSALAGALGVELADETVGVVGAGERQPQPHDLSRSMRLVRTAIALGAGLMLGLPLAARLRKQRDARA